MSQFALINRVAALKKAHLMGQITNREFSRGIRQIWAQFPEVARYE
jgi:hypothetical protein